jgi:hypothetical protein
MSSVENGATVLCIDSPEMFSSSWLPDKNVFQSFSDDLRIKVHHVSKNTNHRHLGHKLNLLLILLMPGIQSFATSCILAISEGDVVVYLERAMIAIATDIDTWTTIPVQNARL